MQIRGLEVVLGPPGTGKTTTVINIVREALESGIHPSRIGFVSFTRAAVLEAKERAASALSLSDADLPWWRTMHSMGLNLQTGNGAKFALLGTKDMREFQKKHGYAIVPPTDDEGHGARFDGEIDSTRDQLLADVYAWSRARMEDMDEAVQTWTGDPIEPESVRIFASRYDAFKQESQKRDYLDMLEGALGLGGPSLDLLVIDEAQDLSPLQIALAVQLMGEAARSVVAGDDDQAIMGFQGASADWLIRIASANPSRVLSQSHRVPALAHTIATKITGRIHERIDKTYAPRTERGWVRRVAFDGGRDMATEALDNGETAAWLCRNKTGCVRAADELFAAGIPYVSERGGRNPLGAKKQLGAARAALRIHEGLPVNVDDVEVLLDAVTSKAANIPHGAKTKAKQLGAGEVTGFLAASVGLGALWSRLRSSDPLEALDKLEPEVLGYYAKVLEEGGEPPQNRVTVTTMHASKGREWETVIVGTDHNGKVQQSLMGEPRVADPEHRVAYVAVTRTKNGLVLLDPKFPTRNVYAYPEAA